MFYFTFLFIAALSANKWAQIEGACNNSLSNSWPVDCTFRAYLITPNTNNQTILTNAIDYAVYNSTTRNSTVWTLARRSSLNSYWNNIRTYIWDNTKYPTQSAKINKIIVDMTAYSSTDCPFKANNFYSIKLELGGCLWGTIGDFVGCGNSTANVAMPSSNATNWPSICPPNVSTSTLPMSTPSSVPTTTISSGSNSSSGSSNSSCKIVTSSNWPVDCDQRAYLITTDMDNKTIMTTVVYDTVYNVNTSNSTTWTTARKLSFNSYWNAMRKIIWDSDSSMSTKINKLFDLLINYSAQDCNWQEYFFSTTLEFSEGCEWGSIGDFMACGNVSANFTMPSSTMAPICSINVTQSPDEVSTDSSGSNNGGGDSSTSSSGGSSGSSNSSCKIVTSSNWPEDVKCAQRGNLLMIDSNNQTIMTKNVFDTVYNVNTSNSTTWTTGRKLSFNSYWNAMRKIIWDSESSMSTKINEFYNLMVSYSAQDCEWQAQFFSTSIVYGDDCEWGSIGDFLACGNASADYEVPTTTESTICPYGGISLNEEDGGNGEGGQTVIVTENGGGNGFTESINISLVTGFVNESFSGQTIEWDTVTPSSINVSDSTESTEFLNVTLFDLINITVSSTLDDSTMSPSTGLVTESSDVPISTSTDMFSTDSSTSDSPITDSTSSPFSESTESSLLPTMSNVTTSPNETELSTVTMTTP